ncbi:sensor histidine kinase KdpD [Sphingomonas sp. RB1R13]|uniref:sensor histidine kinase KdpD n=1 Tax=Sphingomonas sp. RB1R13 TaxID=3096159 RepID=UPI002FC7DCBC
MNDDRRPSPEAFLTQASREGRGRLKILLGAAPGVGKTVEMLREGADLLARGTDVVLGVVETHGRADTEALIAPFELLPRRGVEHGGHSLDEFDIDAMLERRPRLALIDEYAHTNAPGSRHPKRWQDVEELRDAGIDVFTTLNIQHVESLNDVVASFTKVRVRETVPDFLLDDAELEIVDLPPDELIDRLKQGKVYVPQEATRALNNFFSRSNLSALRELALRRAAQTVDRQMLDQLRASGEIGNFAAVERIVVAVGDQPGAENLIRTAKRLADGLRTSWSAVCIETPRTLTLGEKARARIGEALRLAGSLGASVVTVPAEDVVSGLRDHLTETRATLLVIAKQQRSWWFALRHRSVVDQLVRELHGVTVHVVPVEGIAPIAEKRNATAGPPLRNILFALVAVAATTGFAWIIEPIVGINAVDQIYLVPVVVAAAFLGMRSAMVAAVASALAYNFFFLPPLYTFTIEDPQNVVTFVVLVGVGTVVAQLAGGLRRRAVVGARAAGENAAIAAFGQRLAGLSDREGTAGAVTEDIARLLDVSTMLLARDKDGQITTVAGVPEHVTLSPIDLASADWSFERGESAGKDTKTLTASDWQFHPLATSLGVLAVLGVARRDGRTPVPGDRQLLFATIKGQAALAYERIKLEADTREISALRQRDDLRTNLLASIGHDLKTPLTSVVAAADALAASSPPSPTLTTLGIEARRLNRFFDNLVEMTRMQDGALMPQMEATDLTDAVASAVRDLRIEIGQRGVEIDVPPSLPLVSADPRMLHHMLINLIGNAAKFSPADRTITIRGTRSAKGLELAIVDEGPGLPEGDPARLFDRFTRVEGSDRTGGSGLGLANVKGFADVMGLTVSAHNEPGHGASFVIAWPGAMITDEAS